MRRLIDIDDLMEKFNHEETTVSFHSDGLFIDVSRFFEILLKEMPIYVVIEIGEKDERFKFLLENG